MIKTDVNGDMQWSHPFIAKTTDVVQTVDGGYVCVAMNSFVQNDNIYLLPANIAAILQDFSGGATIDKLMNGKDSLVVINPDPFINLRWSSLLIPHTH
ncbi:hypothetical protein JW998_03030 [candidate division KSB1 bacterium]|nr:hypothetical protein [candidate division KSB1 bacterium]